MELDRLPSYPISGGFGTSMSARHILVSSMKLDVLPHCIDKEHPKLYDDITAGAFLEERLRDLGLKK